MLGRLAHPDPDLALVLPPAAARAVVPLRLPAAPPEESTMSKDKGGRETKKPKSDANKKVKGQTPPPASAALDAIRPGAGKK